jgi:hypothetical protein
LPEINRQDGFAVRLQVVDMPTIEGLAKPSIGVAPVGKGQAFASGRFRPAWPPQRSSDQLRGDRIFPQLVGELRYAVDANAPFIVNRHTGALDPTGTALSTKTHIHEYEASLR